jgi:hypothetical protein
MPSPDRPLWLYAFYFSFNADSNRKDGTVITMSASYSADGPGIPDPDSIKVKGNAGGYVTAYIRDYDSLHVNFDPPQGSTEYTIVVSYDHNYRPLKPYIQENYISLHGNAAEAGISDIPSSPGGVTDIPNIIGTIEKTPNGEQIAKIDYTLVTEEQALTYVRYSPDVASVMLTSVTNNGVACILTSMSCKRYTILDKVLSLQSEGFAIEMNTFISYSALRLILSSILFCECDINVSTWNLNFLRRSYYNEFLRKLKRSEWKAFLTYFTVPSPTYDVTYYWKFFKE